MRRGGLPHRLGHSHKKDLQALEKKRKDVTDLRHDPLDAPWVISGAMNSEMLIYMSNPTGADAARGQVCDLFSDEECYNFFKAAGCKPN